MQIEAELESATKAALEHLKEALEGKSSSTTRIEAAKVILEFAAHVETGTPPAKPAAMPSFRAGSPRPE